MEMKIQARYIKGVLVPRSPLDIEENKDVQIIISDEIYNAFSVSGEDDEIGEFFHAQKEVIEDD